MKPIYEPKGKAKEYGDYCVNIYTGCNHGCTYCYAPTVLHKSLEEFDNPQPRAGLLEALQKQLDSGAYRGKLIHLCFTCDPYPAPPVDTSITREVIKAIKAAGAHVQILTKGGKRAARDFDLLDGEDWFGITVSGDEKAEPGAASPVDRLIALWAAHYRGIKTWISYEPVLNEKMVFEAIEHGEWIDIMRIGKLNYHPSDINWGEFGRKCEDLAREFGRKIYIKEDLRREMERNPERKCRVCGCTQYNACPGGCYWVENDLCSCCADKAREEKS